MAPTAMASGGRVTRLTRQYAAGSLLSSALSSRTTLDAFVRTSPPRRVRPPDSVAPDLNEAETQRALPHTYSLDAALSLHRPRVKNRLRNGSP